MRPTSRLARCCGGVLALVVGGAAGAQVLAPGPDAATPCDVKRPSVNFNRWNENWGVLAAPCLERQPFDGLKYIPLGEGGLSYLSLGGGLRERYEHIATPLFGAGSAPTDGYVIQRANVHADLRLGHCLLYTSPSPRDRQKSRMPSSA